MKCKQKVYVTYTTQPVYTLLNQKLEEILLTSCAFIRTIRIWVTIGKLEKRIYNCNFGSTEFETETSQIRHATWRAYSFKSYRPLRNQRYREREREQTHSSPAARIADPNHNSAVLGTSSELLYRIPEIIGGLFLQCRASCTKHRKLEFPD